MPLQGIPFRDWPRHSRAVASRRDQEEGRRARRTRRPEAADPCRAQPSPTGRAIARVIALSVYVSVTEASECRRGRRRYRRGDDDVVLRGRRRHLPAARGRRRAQAPGGCRRRTDDRGAAFARMWNAELVAHVVRSRGVRRWAAVQGPRPLRMHQGDRRTEHGVHLRCDDFARLCRHSVSLQRLWYGRRRRAMRRTVANLLGRRRIRRLHAGRALHHRKRDSEWLSQRHHAHARIALGHRLPV